MVNTSISAQAVDSQIPSGPNSCGNKRIHVVWNNNVRTKEIHAEIFPLFNAVKNALVIVFNPENKNVKQ